MDNPVGMSEKLIKRLYRETLRPSALGGVNPEEGIDKTIPIQWEGFLSVCKLAGVKEF